MASILTQVYKEAATTSKGVVQMNRTLNKIYEDQLKANRAQAKFFDDLRAKNKREERDKKREESDLRKLLAGKVKGNANIEKEEEGEEGGNILDAILGGIGKGFDLLKTVFLSILGDRLLRFAKNKLFPNRKPNRTPNRTPNKPTGRRNGRGGKRNGSGGRGGKGKGRGKGRGPGKGGVKGRTQPPSRAVKPSGNQSVTPRQGNPRFQRPTTTKPTQVKPPTPKPPSQVITRPGGPKPGVLGNARNLAGGIARGGASLGIGLAADWAIAQLDNWVEVKQLEGRLSSYESKNEEERIKIKENVDKKILELKEFIEGGSFAYWASKTTYLGGEIPQETFYRQLTTLREGIDLIDSGELTTKEDKTETPEVPVQARQRGGGIFDVPGHGQGDQVPMMLPPGSFVLNRVAAGEMFARGGSPSGLVPTLLEPGEKVFLPGDPLMDMAMMFNETFSRFQTGGHVGIAVDHIKKDEALSSLTKGQNDWIKEGSSSVISKTPWNDVTLETKIHAYLDKYKVATIGWGNTFYDNIRNGKQPVKMGDEITKAKADKIMNTNVSALASDYSREIPHWNKMSDMQKAGLISMGYNAPNFYASETFAPKLKKSLQKGDMEAVAANLSWGGPSPKRISEAKSMMKMGPKDVSKEMSGLTPTASDMAWYKETMKLQKGGLVDDGASRGKSQPSSSGKAKGGSGTGVEAILSAAESNIGLSKGTGEQCANTTRAVLKAAGHPAGTKVTQKGDLDPEGTKYNGPGFAASFAGSDMGTVNKNFNNVKPGEVMLWKDTYKKYGDQPAGAITHVGIAGEDNMQYDHSKARGWEKVPRESRNFAASINLNGEASGDGENNSNNSSGSSGSGGGGGLFGSLLAPITGALGNAFAPIKEAMDKANPFGEITSMLSKEMGAITKGISERLEDDDMKDLMSKMKEEMDKVTKEMTEGINKAKGIQSSGVKTHSGSSSISSGTQMVAKAMQKIREVKDPEAEDGNQTIVQVIPGKQQQSPQVQGQAAQNVPPGLSVRCSSWAAADYRYDRSLNTETL